jgi:hypothetical protein
LKSEKYLNYLKKKSLKKFESLHIETQTIEMEEAKISIKEEEINN